MMYYPGQAQTREELHEACRFSIVVRARLRVHGGVLAEMVPGSADRGMAPYQGDFIWQDAGQTRAVKNTGTTFIEFVEFELK